jgi:hypothetical protein
MADINQTELASMIATGIARGMSMAQGQVRSDAFSSRWDAYKEAALGTVAANTIYGRNSIFDPCQGTDIWGLQVETNGLMNWLGWRANNFAEKRVSFIQWWGPDGTDDGDASTLATSPCDDPTTWQYGDAGYTLCHKSWYSVGGEVLDPASLSLGNRCETTPRYRLNGVRITDDLEWQLNGMMNVLQQAINYGVIHGTHDNANEMNGLEAIIRTGYTDKDGQPTPAVDSILVEWNNDDLDGAVNGFGNFFDYLDEVIDEIEYRAQNMGGIREADMALLTSRFMGKELLNKFACYSVCGSLDYDGSDPAFRAELNRYRRSLNGGPLYDGTQAIGYIQVKGGRRIPIIVHDTLTIGTSSTNYCSDIYLLTRRIGNGDVLYGEYMNLRIAENAYRQRGLFTKFVTDPVGRFLQSIKFDNFCSQLILGTSPEIYLAAPWAQARFQDVCAAKKRKPITGDPYQTTFHFTEGALYPAQAWDRDCNDTAASVEAQTEVPLR